MRLKKGDDSVHKKVELLIQFYNEFNRYPLMHEVYQGEKIGGFFGNIKTGNTKITSEEKVLLESIGIPIKCKSHKQKAHQKVLALISFCNLYNRKPKKDDVYDGFRIGVFYKSIMNGKANITIDDKVLLRQLNII